MKNYIISIIFIFISLIVVPIVALSDSKAVVEATESNNFSASDSEASTTQEPLSEKDEDKTATVFLSKSEKIIEMSEFEYVCGSVAAEMPLSYHEEALKAQAIACFTNYKRLKASGDKASKGADITDNASVHQGYINYEERKEKWGENFEKYESKLESIVKSVEGEVLTYKNDYCICAFSAICTGRTESAENIWGSNVPYLVSVKSSGDTLSPEYSSTTTISVSEFISTMKTLGVSLKKDSFSENTIKITESSKAGTALKVKIDSKVFSGQELRSAFSLRSPAFKITATKNEVTFKVSGYGHGVGMSQYGADYMARQGSSYKEILKHYYKGTAISL